MYANLQPFPHEDGAPASWEDNRLLKEAVKEQQKSTSQSLAQSKRYLSMLNSIMK